MIKPGHSRSVRVSLLSACAVILLASGLLTGLSTLCFADDGPKPDPAGTATGDKTAAVDAAGNSFVVTEPTDKTAPEGGAAPKPGRTPRASPTRTGRGKRAAGA